MNQEPLMQPRPGDAPGSASLSKAGLILLLVLAGLFLAGALPRWRARAALRSETEELSVPSVTVVSPGPGTAQGALVLPAEIRAFQEASIHARVTGYLKRWTEDIGNRVREGQLLAEIDTPELNQELARARAVRTEAESNLAFARMSAARWQELVKNATVSQQETEEKLNDVATRTAALEAARAGVRRLEDLQSFQRVTAPFDGVVTVRRAEVGALVTAAGQQELFRVAQVNPLRVFVRVPQPVSGLISNGLAADLLVTGQEGRVFPASVARTAGAMDPSTRTLLTELAVDNSKGEILAGAYGQIRFHAAENRRALVLPANTLLFRQEGPQLGVVDGSGKVELRNVVLGRDYGTTLEVTQGVSPSDRVILNPSDSLVAGAVVRVVETPAAVKPKP
jgi:RND family efflux transporter MFP subunit